MSLETNARDEIVRFAASIYERSLTFGASGNISVRIEDGWLMTPTGSTMGSLDPARLSKPAVSSSPSNHHRIVVIIVIIVVIVVIINNIEIANI